MDEGAAANKKPSSPSFNFAKVAIGVISGLAVIAAIMVYGGTKPTGCKNTLHLATATAIESAVINFHTEYERLPDIGNHITTDTADGIRLLTILLGMEDPAGKMQNSRAVKFLSVREGKNKRKGLIYSEDGKSIEGLFDAWGNGYVVELDTRNEGRLHFNLGTKTIDLKDRLVAVYSPGPDKKPGTSDDVRTW